VELIRLPISNYVRLAEGVLTEEELAQWFTAHVMAL
jgi:hypothetical protein